MGSLSRRLKQIVSRPLKRLELKIKSAAQRFVIKTVSKHSGEIGQTGQAVSWDSSQIDALLLAFLRSSQRKELRSGFGLPEKKPFAAVPFGADRILAGHPHADFIFCDTGKHRNSALMAIGQFEQALTTKLESIVGAGDCVYVMGDEAGFHSLTVAKLVGKNGRVVCLDEDSTGLRSHNLTSNLVTNTCHCPSSEERRNLPDPDLILVRIADSDSLRLEGIPEQITTLSELHPHATLVLQPTSGQEVADHVLAAIRDSVNRLAGAGRKMAANAHAMFADSDTTGGEFNLHEPLMFEPACAPETRSRAA